MTKTTKITSTIKAGMIASLAMGAVALGSAHTANAFTAAPSGLKTEASTTAIQPVHFISKRSGKRSDYYGSAKGYKGLKGFRGGFIGFGGVQKNGYNGKNQHFKDGYRSSHKKHVSKSKYTTK